MLQLVRRPGWCALVMAGIASTGCATVPDDAYLPPPRVEFSADYVFDSPYDDDDGRLHYAPGMYAMISRRWGFIIFRFDRNLVWFVDHKEKRYFESGPLTVRDGLSAPFWPQWEESAENVRIRLGRVIAGVRTRRVVARFLSEAFDVEEEVTLWTTKEGIPLKSVSRDLRPERARGPETVSIRNVRIGPQDPTLFEVEENYTLVNRTWEPPVDE